MLGGRIPALYYRDSYSWDQDFPLHLQAKEPNAESVITLEFELAGPEIADFKGDVRSNLNGTLPIRIALGAKGANITVPKRGPGGNSLSAKWIRVARYISTRAHFQYIPAVRTAAQAQHVVNRMASDELAAVEKDPEYIAALPRIEQVQNPYSISSQRAYGPCSFSSCLP
jgi:hypothetical protein